MSAWDAHPDLWSELVRWLRCRELLPLLGMCRASRSEARRELLRQNREFFARHIVHFGWWKFARTHRQGEGVANYFPLPVVSDSLNLRTFPFAPQELREEERPLIAWTNLVFVMRIITTSVNPDTKELQLQHFARAARAWLSIGADGDDVLFFRFLAQPDSKRPLEEGRCWLVKADTGEGEELPPQNRYGIVPVGYNAVRVRQATVTAAYAPYRRGPPPLCSLRIHPDCDSREAKLCGWCGVYHVCDRCAEKIGAQRCSLCERLMACCPPRECGQCGVARCSECPCGCIPKRVKLLRQ